MEDRLRLRTIFDRLSPTGKITSESFKMAGYPYVRMDGDLHKWLKAINWCNNQMTHRFHAMGMTFWFTNEEDATAFALTWV